MCCYMDMRWLPYVAVFNLLTNSAIEFKKMIQKMIHDALSFCWQNILFSSTQ